MENDLYSFLTGRVVFSGSDAVENVQEEKRR